MDVVSRNARKVVNAVCVYVNVKMKAARVVRYQKLFEWRIAYLYLSNLNNFRPGSYVSNLNFNFRMIVASLA